MDYKRRLLPALALSWCFAFSAQAAIPPSCGWYIEGTVGESKEHNISHPGLASTQEGLAGTGSIGYKFMPFMAVEGGYSIYSYNRLTLNSALVAKERFNSFQLALKGILPIANTGFEPFAKVGAARLRLKKQINNQDLADSVGYTSGNTSSTGFYAALGAQYYFMPELAIVLEWARADGSKNRTGSQDLYSAGLSFIFD